MDEMERIYHDLKGKREAMARRLSERQEELDAVAAEKKSIVIKRIHGELYYYAQWRNEGKVKSQFLSPVSPGAVAGEERLQSRIHTLEAEVRELRSDLESMDKMIACLGQRRRKTKLTDTFSFEVYWKDEITARVYVRSKEVIISRFTEHPVKQLFAESRMTRYQLGRIFELRCWDRGRPDTEELLKHLGLQEYNPYEIVRRTHGVSFNDYIWFRFPEEKITSKDVLVR